MLMADWQQHIQIIIFSLLFSFLVAKLFSLIFTSRNVTHQITRPDDSNTPLIDKNDDVVDHSSVIAEEGSNNSNNSSNNNNSDDDWEGVESTELDEAFSAATAFVAATAADRSSSRNNKVTNEVQLQLYALYKIATEGPCTAPQPSALKMTARAKWQAWQKLGAMPPEEAMMKYIDIVTELYPTWLSGSATNKKGEESSGASNADSKGPMGPVFSSFAYEEDSGNELKLDAIHAFAREGDEENLLKCIESGVPVNLKDSEGHTPLHWAVDRGHLSITKLLLSRNADVNAKMNKRIYRHHLFAVRSTHLFVGTQVFQDHEGQTPLHYAAVCERQDIAEFLVQHNADIQMVDNDGNCPRDVCELNWPWLQHQEQS